MMWKVKEKEKGKGKGKGNGNGGDDDGNKPTLLDWLDKLWIPLLGVGAALIGNWLGDIGNRLTALTEYNQRVERYLTVSSEASGQRQKDLTNYSNVITNLVSRNARINLFSNNNNDKDTANRLKYRIRGETLITLDKLNDTEHEGYIDTKSLVTSIDQTAYIDLQDTFDNLKELSDYVKKFLGNNIEPVQEKIQLFNDSGKLKGSLVRSLYESRLIHRGEYPPIPNQPRTSFMSGGNLINIDLRNQWLPRIDLRTAEMKWAKLNRATLSRALLRESNLQAADMRGIHLNGADFNFRPVVNGRTVNLRRANLQGANLSPSGERISELQRANLQGADLSPYKYELRLEAYKFYNKHDAYWLQKNECAPPKEPPEKPPETIVPCTRRTNLRGADLRGADLTDADLTEADLTDADLRPFQYTVPQSQLSSENSKLSVNCISYGSTAQCTRRTNLTKADLRGATLTGVVNWTNAILTGAITDNCFAGVRNSTLTKLQITSAIDAATGNKCQ